MYACTLLVWLTRTFPEDPEPNNERKYCIPI